MKLVRVTAGLLCLTAACAFADFSYEQTSKMTGGMLAGAMKVAAVFSKQAREPIRTQVMVKGDRMAHAGPQRISVIDLKSETITEIDLQKKTYSVMTFAEMAQALQNMSQQGGSKADADNVQMNFKASVNETGQTKQISGFNTREVILTLEMESTDQKSGGKGAMSVNSDQWLASEVPGYEELTSFHRRMAQKIAWVPGSANFAPGRSDMAKAMADLAKEGAKLKGVPVLQVAKFTAAGQPGEGQQPPPPAASQEQQRSESPSIGGALVRLGGLGGLGRRKKQSGQEENTPPAAQQNSAGVLMELTTESSGFSTAPVDDSIFEVPSGFRKVDSPLLKASGK